MDQISIPMMLFYLCRYFVNAQCYQYVYEDDPDYTKLLNLVITEGCCNRLQDGQDMLVTCSRLRERLHGIRIKPGRDRSVTLFAPKWRRPNEGAVRDKS